MAKFGHINPAILSVLLAATMWGMLGVAYELIDRNVEIDRFTIATLRAVGASVVLVVWWWRRDTTVFAVRRADLPQFVVMGLVSVTLFYVVLIYAFASTSVAVGTLLLYLAPALVTIGAAVFLGEQVTRLRLFALAISFLGCALVVNITNPDYLSGNLWGIALGLASAVCYGSYSLLAKPMLTRYRGATVQTVHMVFGSGALLLIKLAISPTEWPSFWQTILIALSTGIVLSVLPVALYTAGLNGLPSSEASILATWEPVVAVMLAATVLGERLGLVQSVGACLVVGAVVLLGTGHSKRRLPEIAVAP